MKTLKGLFGAALAVTLLGIGATQAADVTFMGYSYSEEAAKPSIDKIDAGFTAKTGKTVEPIASAFGDLQKNLLLRVRSHTQPSVVQISERWLPSFASLPGLVDYNTVFGTDYLAKTYAPEALAMGQIDGKQLALPLMSGSIGMVANKAVLTEAGITAVPTTVDEFKADLVGNPRQGAQFGALRHGDQEQLRHPGRLHDLGIRLRRPTSSTPRARSSSTATTARRRWPSSST